MPNPPHTVTTPVKLIVRVLQDVITKESFDNYADLAEALKCRCAKLKIPYDARMVSEAIEQLERGGKAPLICPQAESITELPAAPEIISRTEAGEIYRTLVARYEQEQRAVPRMRPSSQPEHFPDLVEVALWR